MGVGIKAGKGEFGAPGRAEGPGEVVAGGLGGVKPGGKIGGVSVDVGAADAVVSAGAWAAGRGNWEGRASRFERNKGFESTGGGGIGGIVTGVGVGVAPSGCAQAFCAVN